MFHSFRFCSASSVGLRSSRTNVAPAAASLRTICSAIAPMAPVRRIVFPERSIEIIGDVFPFRADILHDSVLFEGGHGAASCFERLPNQFFAASFFEGFRESLGRRSNGNNTDSVDVSEHVVAWLQANVTNLDADSVIHYLIAWSRVLSVRPIGKHREIHLQNRFGIADVAV